MIDRERGLWIYKTMCRIRSFEEKAVALFEANKLRGSMHLYVGEEAIAATVCSRLNRDDYIASTHRGHGHCIAKGADERFAMAELMGKATGYCKGRGGSMHIADFTTGNLGANAIVGGGIPIAVGAGLSIKMQHQDGRVSVSFFGDSTTNQGAWHEAMNLAALWKLPVIFICENNGFGITVPQWQATSVEDISVRAASYGIPGITCYGNDPDEIDKAMDVAIERARGGIGPTLIECKTYRWLGHWVGDPQVYRTREEVEAWKEKCPIKNYAPKLLAMGVSQEELDNIMKDARQEADDAAEYALNSPEPDPAHVLDDVFYEEEA